MRDKDYYDEKQLYDRGKCFQIGFFTALICVWITYFVTDLLEIKFSDYLNYVFCIWIPLSVYAISLIVKNAYDGVNSNAGKTVSIIFLICGILLLCFRIIMLVIDNGHFIDNEEIGSFIASMIQSVCMISMSVVYFIKQYRNKKALDEKD